MPDTNNVPACHLYDAAGNKILWLDGGYSDGEVPFDKLKVIGRRLARRCAFAQDMTAVLFRSPDCLRALFWNPDGTEETICGNAIRCAPHFLSKDSAPIDSVAIETPSGTYLGRKLGSGGGSIAMPAAAIRIQTKKIDGDLLLNVGTPHRIRLVDHEWPDDGVKDAVACSESAEPVNFNLVHKIAPFHFRVRTFERGAGETFSCGTAAAAIVAALGDFSANAASPQHPYLIEFASGEKLTAAYKPSLDLFEISGRVELLVASSIPHLSPL
jgi:diaminopimelate epimerase